MIRYDSLLFDDDTKESIRYDAILYVTDTFFMPHNECIYGQLHISHFYM